MQAHEAALDIMAVLKSSTAERHAEIEQLMPFFKETFSLQDYIRTLGIFLGFFEPLERRLASVVGWRSVGIDLKRRRRAYRLRDDLIVLGVSEEQIAHIPRCHHLPDLANRYNGLGCLYVLEGSTLGGQLIARELERRFGIAEFSGSSFFHSHGSNVGEAWKEFCSAARTYGNDPIKEHAAVKSAQETFACFDTWIREANQDAE
jgi:heme oxygenase